MAFLDRIFKRNLDASDARKGFQAVGTFLSDGPLFSFFNQGLGASGKTVTEDTAITNSTVYACIRILTQSISTLPIHLYSRKDDGSRRREESNPLELLVNDSPNPMMTPSDFIGALQYQLLIYNTAYAQIIRNSFGEPVELWPLLTKKVTLKDVGGEFQYQYTHGYKDVGAGRSELIATFIDPKDIIAIKGVTQNGKIGVNLLQTKKDVIGTSLAADEVASSAFKNTSLTSGALVAPEGSTITEKGARNLVEGWSETFGGPVNAGKVCFLSHGVDFKPISVDLERLQLLETRKFQVRDIARIYGVPMHMLADPSAQSYNSNEQQAIDFVTHTLRPWLVSWEQALAKSLLTAPQRRSMFFEFDTNKLLKGDLQSRYTSYQVGIQNGWLSADEVRIMENMEPIPGESGNQYLLPMNMESASFKKGKEQKLLEEPQKPLESSEHVGGVQDTKKNLKRDLDVSEALYGCVLSQIDEYERVALGNIAQRCDTLERLQKDICKFAKNSIKYVESRLQPFVDQGVIQKEEIPNRYQKNLRQLQSILEGSDNEEVKVEEIRKFIESI